MIERKTVTVFGSSIPKPEQPEYHTAYRLGTMLALNGMNVCTGGYAGIMEAVSKGAVEKGGKATGITLEYAGSTPNKFLTREIKCNTLFQRVEKLVSLGDAFIVLQGGTGTLLELAAVWEFMNKKIIPVKPVACHSSMWKEIGSIMDKQLATENRMNGLVKYFNDPADIVEFLKGKIF